ncbi:MAG: hypothetical protein L6R42_006957 [Xanthoria sp. 1 TBL-2021]|nr:MAG: hypothetical protein L6R42_006957 [Xanthoria sp. 1 TBL-2021]
MLVDDGMEYEVECEGEGENENVRDTAGVEGLEGRSPVVVVEDAAMEDAAAAATAAPIHTVHKMPADANEYQANAEWDSLNEVEKIQAEEQTMMGDWEDVRAWD